MTIRELRAKLFECVNQDAKVNIVLGDDDNDIFDTTEFEVFSDHSGDDYQDIFIHIDKLPYLKKLIELPNKF
jgi:hypothetical protein